MIIHHNFLTQYIILEEDATQFIILLRASLFSANGKNADALGNQILL